MALQHATDNCPDHALNLTIGQTRSRYKLRHIGDGVFRDLTREIVFSRMGDLESDLVNSRTDTEDWQVIHPCRSLTFRAAEIAARSANPAQHLFIASARA